MSGLLSSTHIIFDMDALLNIIISRPSSSWNTASRYGSPYLKQDMEKLEKVQRRATKMIQGYKDLSYEERLIRCGLTTLGKRRSRGDSIKAYKIITGKESIQWEKFVELAPRDSEAHIQII